MRMILVTGSAGFIGSNLAEALLARGYGVVGLDNFDPYYDRSIKEKNLESLLWRPGFYFYEADIRDQETVERLLAEYRPQAVAALAALAGVRSSLEQPDRYIDVNAVGTARLLEACRQTNVPRLVFASSSSVYGGANRPPFSEDQPISTPLSPYAASKVAGEAICHAYHHLYGLQIVCLRYFTVYGPRQRQDLAISKFTTLITSGQPIQLYGDGSTSRDYTYVDDIVRGTLAALESDVPWAVLNLGGCQPVTLHDLVTKLQVALQREAIIERLPLQPGDMSCTCADVTHAREVLGWQAEVSLDEGLRRFVQWYEAAKQSMLVGV